jgi:hypothetical protein
MKNAFVKIKEHWKLVAICCAVLTITTIAFISFIILKSETVQEQPVVTEKVSTVQPPARQPDLPSSMDAPVKVVTKDGLQHFYYGAPAGHNNVSPKKIFITLHGTEGSAEQDYGVWKPFVSKTDFALASLNWWDGSGDRTSDYSTPEKINTQIHDFLSAQGYTSKDLVVFEGFSRGSANSYSVVAYDRASTTPMFDVAVSSSGGKDDNYFNLSTKSIEAQAQSSTIFGGVSWIMACGYKDQSPSRDGCAVMEKASTFVKAKGATVLGILSDKNAGHGALTTSKLDLPKQMFDLINTKL